MLKQDIRLHTFSLGQGYGYTLLTMDVYGQLLVAKEYRISGCYNASQNRYTIPIHRHDRAICSLNRIEKKTSSQAPFLKVQCSSVYLIHIIGRNLGRIWMTLSLTFAISHQFVFWLVGWNLTKASPPECIKRYGDGGGQRESWWSFLFAYTKRMRIVLCLSRDRRNQWSWISCR